MVQKELLRNSVFLISFLCFFIFACKSKHKDVKPQQIYISVDVSQIPSDTILAGNKNLKIENGIYYIDNKPFSGFIKEFFLNGRLKKIGSYYMGKLHGISKSFYEDGTQRDERAYKENLGYGRHIGFWENGNKKFDFFYINDKSEGVQRQWYPNGQPYLELHFKNDSEEGMQKAWRENGKLFANYEVKDGIRYGLQKSNLCYTLKDQKIK